MPQRLGARTTGSKKVPPSPRQHLCACWPEAIFPPLGQKAGPEPFPAAAVDARLTTLEEQAQSYRSVEQTLAKIGTELTAIQGELATLKNQMPDASALTAMLQRVDEQRTVIERISASLAQLQPPAPARSELRPEPAARRVHIFEKGKTCTASASRPGSPSIRCGT